MNERCFSAVCTRISLEKVVIGLDGGIVSRPATIISEAPPVKISIRASATMNLQTKYLAPAMDPVVIWIDEKVLRRQ
jgi:hypothetical protein